MTKDPKDVVIHRIEIVETLYKIVEVELPADQVREAEQQVRDMYHNEEIVLSADDYLDTEFIYLDAKEK